jgi:hypothetical protein
METEEDRRAAAARSNVWNDVRKQDWLRHRWKFTITQDQKYREAPFVVSAGGHNLARGHD